MDDAELIRLSAIQATARLRDGEISSQRLVEACLERIAAVDEGIRAWAYLDADYALEQAREADLRRSEGKALGPLHGLPVGVKDIFDTRDMPTEDGTVLHAGERPIMDATVVSLLRQAGAVIMGKTVTTELAVYAPGKTRNPHDPERTPGGSSSGSAAAVASYMVPLAIGSQTNGSVIRPAAFCGVVGFKPSHGLISRHRVLQLSRVLDHVGVFARTVQDAALIAQQLIGFDARDPDTRPYPRPDLLGIANQEPPVTPRLAFVRTPVWEQAEAATKAAFVELVEHVNRTVAATEDAVQEAELHELFNQAHEWQRRIMEADLAKNLAREYDTGKDKLSDVLRGMIERGREVSAVDYGRAIDGAEVLNGLLGATFQSCDAILTPAAPGEAPLGLDSTGSPAFCTIWTLCGLPAVTLPVMQGENGLPLGVQLVGPKGDDARLLRTAAWLVAVVNRE